MNITQKEAAKRQIKILEDGIKREEKEISNLRKEIDKLEDKIRTSKTYLEEFKRDIKFWEKELSKY